jgi:hypothetical protein
MPNPPDKKFYEKPLTMFFIPFALALQEQIFSDNERWGNEWKRRPIEATEDWEHQNVRIINRINEYYTEWTDNDTPIPWLKVAGLAFIAWVRETQPDWRK